MSSGTGPAGSADCTGVPGLLLLREWLDEVGDEVELELRALRLVLCRGRRFLLRFLASRCLEPLAARWLFLLRLPLVRLALPGLQPGIPLAKLRWPRLLR